MTHPEVDLRIDGIMNTHRLSVKHGEHTMELDLEGTSRLISDLLAGRALLVHVYSLDLENPEPAETEELEDLDNEGSDEALTWHREKPGVYFSHPTPDITLKAERIKGTKAWIAKRNGKPVSKQPLPSYTAAKEILRDGLGSPPVKR